MQKRDISQRNEPLVYLGFLVDENLQKNLQPFYEFSKELGLKEKDVKIFTFIETKRRIPTLRNNQISNKEFTLRGEIDNQNASEFLDFPFDVLVGLYKGKHTFLDAMVSKSKAKFKIGFKDADARLYDLLINVQPSNLEITKNEIEKYLKILNKI
ncbi:hypothetical protein KIV10_10390 [Aequorivita echinoideorum]|uniref:Uncharacterized protein n=1 Tax=Aequorivita echinoideorum TaxID=1549647 RepID=A0ABS5S5W8_9FLAO|nr:hypothetical protein [Aequorivita echinoideorum]MBT0608593.1 hypothetical protein [Aequorivita echinoideorum]